MSGDDTHPFAGAPCRSPELFAQMRADKSSPWDYVIDGEQKLARQERHRRSIGLCFACPKRQLCREVHEQLSNQYGYKLSGIWAGRVFPDTEPKVDLSLVPLTLMSYEDLVA
ncbi:hypothetical protein [Nocardia brasiliensis]|uniref:hypothetical protein n=1 Tax=Nocardia brasiliensis TaxID=37326 RepID=UPI00245504AB|nr:hypothetical protein [Nocardia brasiliensis]